ncbi:MAG TPA: TonB-dependent receptor [Patescibacteria group bacterium]|nr:TonB-dependent receptor [Patescibacteria group bacterium]
MDSVWSRRSLRFFCGSGLLISLVFFVAGISALAQLPTASILGTVKDPSGAAVPGVTVVATNVDTGATRTATTDAAGNYNVVQLPVGHYSVRVSRAGFKTITHSGITLSVAQNAVINFTLQVGATQQTVTVTAAVPLVNTTNATLGGLVSNQTLEQLPLNGRDYVSLTLLQAGVIRDMNIHTKSEGAVGTTFTANGAPVRANNFMLDGAIMQNSGGRGPAGLSGDMLGMDGIQEFRMITTNFPAEYGVAMGSQIIMVSKSGTNQFHGDAYEYLRNSVLDARNYFDPPPSALFGHRNPEFRKNQFGASIGGPIRKNKTFFDVVYEGVKEGLGVLQNTVVPAAGCHPPGASAANGYEGTGHSAANPAMIWDGTGTQPTGTIGPCPDLAAINPNPGSPYVVPLSQYTAPYLSLYPSPNNTAGTTSEYNFTGNTPLTENFGQIRIDQNFSSSDSMFGRWTIDNGSFDNADQTAFISDIGTGAMPFISTLGLSRNQYLTLAENHIFSANLLNTFRLSFSRTHTNANLQYNGLPNNNLGFPVLPVANKPMGVLITLEGGYTPMGTNAPGSSYDIQNVYTLSDDVSWTHGNHSFMFGMLINRWNFGTGNALLAGELDYPTLADFFTSSPSVIQYTSPAHSYSKRFWRYWTYGFYAQDQWRTTSRLTLNLGLRYQFMRTPSEMEGLNSRVLNDFTDPFTLGPVMANNTLRDFSPRFGLAWDVFGNGKTAVRLGSGLYYSSLGNVDASLSQNTGGQLPFTGQTVFTGSEISPASNNPIPIPSNEYTSAATRVTPQWMDYNIHPPYLIEWNLSIQQQLPFHVGLTVAYVGNRGIHLWSFRDSNPIIPTSFGPCGDPASRCVPGGTFNGVTTPTGVPFWDTGSSAYHVINPNLPSSINTATVANSNYNGLEIDLNKEAGHGLSFGSAFTWGKILDDTQGQQYIADCHSSGGQTDVYPLNMMALDYGLACFASPYNWVLNLVYRLPGIGSSGLVSKVTKGWRVSTVLSIQGGYPFSVTMANNRSNSGNSRAQPDLVNVNNAGMLAKYYPSSCTGGVASGCPYTPVLYNKNGLYTGNINDWFNVNMFSMAPEFNSPENTGGATCATGGNCIGQLGTSGRDILFGPPLRNVDFSVAKDTKAGFLGEAGSVEFRADFFNLFNHPNFGMPNSTILDGNITDLGPFSEAPQVAGARINSTIPNNQREIQFSLTLHF